MIEYRFFGVCLITGNFLETLDDKWIRDIFVKHILHDHINGAIWQTQCHSEIGKPYFEAHSKKLRTTLRREIRRDTVTSTGWAVPLIGPIFRNRFAYTMGLKGEIH